MAAVCLAAFLVAIALGAWCLLLLQIVPKIDQWRGEIAQQATSTLGVPVRIARVSGRADGWWPEISLQDVELLDDAGRVALRLPAISARLSPSTLWPTSLWNRELHVDRLVLTRPDLEIRRDPAGRLHIGGLTLDHRATTGEGRHAADWLLDQALIRIDQGRINWVDEARGSTPLRLSRVDLSMRQRPGLGRRRFEWSLGATPPPEFGQRFHLQATLTQPLWASRTAAKGAAARPSEAPLLAPWWGRATRPGDWWTWSGQFKADLPHVDVQSLQRHATLPVDVQGGRGRLALTLDIHKGQPRDAVLDADVRAVSLRLAQDLPPLAFRQVAGRFVARHEARQSSLAWQGLRFTTDDGLSWPTSSASLQWRHPAMAARTGVLMPQWRGDAWQRTQEGRFETDHIDLALLARLANKLPIASGLRQELAALSPQGRGDRLSLSWTGPLNAPSTYRAQGTLVNLAWRAGEARPGLAGASVDFSASEAGGRARLAVRRGWAEFPGVFEEPRIPVDELDAEVAWRVQPDKGGAAPPRLTVDIPEARFANADAQGRLKATWRTGTGNGVGAGGRYPGHLDLTGHLDRAEGTRVWRYLPATILADARHYVRDAVKAGKGENVRFETRGDLWSFPFKDGRGGRFRIDVPVKDATLDYVPGQQPPAGAKAASPYWPAFTRLNGRLIFEGQSMRIEQASATVAGVGASQYALRKVRGRIDDLAADHPLLHIEGEGEGPLNDLLAYVNASPVGLWTGRMLDEAQGSGRAGLRLALDIPLNDVSATRLSGILAWTEQDQAALRLAPQLPQMDHVRGQIHFTHDRLEVTARTQVWGQEIQVQASPDAQGTTRFVASGLLSAEGMRQARDLPAVARLARHLDGQTHVTVSVALNRGAGGAAGTGFNARPELQIGTNLQGMALNLPAPFTKEAAAAWPVRILRRVEADGVRDQIQVELGGLGPGGPVAMRADYRRQLAAQGPIVSSGSIGVAQGTPLAPVPLPAFGVAARVALPALDLDAWQQFAESLQPPEGSGGSAPPGPPSSATLLDDHLPGTLALKAGALTWRQRTVEDVAVTLAHPSPGVWRAQIDAPRIAGQVEVRPDAVAATAPHVAGANRRVVARLTRLKVPEAEAESLQQQAASQMMEAPTDQVPALDIVVDQFEWRGLPLGRLEVEAVNRLVSGAASTRLPEWRLTKLRLSNPDAQLQASGNWAALGAQGAREPTLPSAALPARQRAAFTFTLELSNSGNLLSRLGLPQTLRGGKGTMAGQVSWLGSPLEPDPPTLSGDVSVLINEGQFLKAEPGVAKLLGVLSLQSLPRRLVLDFRDVFQSGFAFDRIEGDVKIAQGVAATRNLRMRGVQALVLMEGQADLARETQNLRVFVVPEINAGTASLAYAAINPAIGLGTFIAQVLLRKAVVEASTREFTIKGSWADPQVERVPRSSVALPGEIDEGAETRAQQEAPPPADALPRRAAASPALRDNASTERPLCRTPPSSLRPDCP